MGRVHFFYLRIFRKEAAMLGRTCIVTAFALAASFTISSAQTVIDGPIESPVNGHYYSVLSNSNWTSAEAVAETMGGNLATVRSTAEENWIQDTFATYPYLWLGFYDAVQDTNGKPHAQNFVWVDGEPVTYVDWAPGEPNNLNGDEYWTELVLTNSSTDASGTWNDIYNSADPTYEPNSYGPVYGLAEIIPEPASLSFLALGGTTLLCRRRQKSVR